MYPRPSLPRCRCGVISLGDDAVSAQGNTGGSHLIYRRGRYNQVEIAQHISEYLFSSPQTSRPKVLFTSSHSSITLPPSALKGTGTKNDNTAFSTIRAQLKKTDRQTRVRREILSSLVIIVDKFVTAHKQSTHHQYARTICEKFVQFIFFSDYAKINEKNYISLRVRSQITISDSDKFIFEKVVSWANIVQTLKNLFVFET